MFRKNIDNSDYQVKIFEPSNFIRFQYTSFGVIFSFPVSFFLSLFQDLDLILIFQIGPTILGIIIFYWFSRKITSINRPINEKRLKNKSNRKFIIYFIGIFVLLLNLIGLYDHSLRGQAIEFFLIFILFSVAVGLLIGFGLIHNFWSYDYEKNNFSRDIISPMFGGCSEKLLAEDIRDVFLNKRVELGASSRSTARVRTHNVDLHFNSGRSLTIKAYYIQPIIIFSYFLMSKLNIEIPQNRYLQVTTIKNQSNDHLSSFKTFKDSRRIINLGRKIIPQQQITMSKKYLINSFKLGFLDYNKTKWPYEIISRVSMKNDKNKVDLLIVTPVAEHKVRGKLTVEKANKLLVEINDLLEDVKRLS